MTTRQREILFRHGLAEHFTSPSTSMKPRLEWSEIQELIDAGALAINVDRRIRLTVSGLAEVRGELALALGKQRKYECEAPTEKGAETP